MNEYPSIAEPQIAQPL